MYIYIFSVWIASPFYRRHSNEAVSLFGSTARCWIRNSGRYMEHCLHGITHTNNFTLHISFSVFFFFFLTLTLSWSFLFIYLFIIFIYIILLVVGFRVGNRRLLIWAALGWWLFKRRGPSRPYNRALGRHSQTHRCVREILAVFLQ